MKCRISLSLLILFFLISCNKEDKIPPDVFISNLSGITDLSDSSTIIIKTTLVDNDALQSMSLTIRHSDSIVLQNPFGNLISPFDTIIIESLAGNTAIKEFLLPLKSNFSIGLYELKVTAIDAAGNSAYDSRFLRIESTVDTLPPVVDTIYLADTLQGLQFNFEALVKDNQGLAMGSIYLRQRPALDTLNSFLFPLSDTSFIIQQPISLPYIGNFQFRIRVRDIQNNEVERDFNFVVIQ